MINSTTHQQPVNHQAVQNHSRRGGQSSPHNFRPQHNQNNQLQQLLNLLLPLLQQLLSQFKNSNCCQSKDLNLTSKELADLNQALYPEGTREAAGFPGPPNATGVIDNDCNGKISIGDEVRTTFTDPPTQETINGTLIVDQEIIDRLNSQQAQNIQFDEGSPKPITHFGQGSDTPIRSIEFFSDGYQGILEDGSGFNAQIAAGGSDPSPLINGLIVTRADYTNDTATYTLENGTTLTGLKPFYPQL